MKLFTMGYVNSGRVSIKYFIGFTVLNEYDNGKFLMYYRTRIDRRMTEVEFGEVDNDVI